MRGLLTNVAGWAAVAGIAAALLGRHTFAENACLAHREAAGAVFGEAIYTGNKKESTFLPIFFGHRIGAHSSYNTYHSTPV